MADYRDRANKDRDRKPAWRELDRKKDRSAHVDGGGPKPSLDERKVTTGYHQYRNELDRLFSTGEKSRLVDKVMSGVQAVTPDAMDPAVVQAEVPRRQQILRAIRASSTPADIARHLDEFLGQWEMPQDIDILAQALEHPDEEIQKSTLAMISRWLDGHVASRSSLLRSRVRRLATRSDDEQVVKLAREVNRKLPT